MSTQFIAKMALNVVGQTKLFHSDHQCPNNHAETVKLTAAVDNQITQKTNRSAYTEEDKISHSNSKTQGITKHKLRTTKTIYKIGKH